MNTIHKVQVGPDNTSPPSSRDLVPHAVKVLIDGESIDRSLGNILRHRPRSSERPKWERFVDYARMHFAHQVDAFFFLVDRGTPALNGFVSVLPDLGIEPVLLKPQPKVPVVDEAILATLPYVPCHDDLVIATHDGGYMAGLAPLLSAGRRVAIVGFEEMVSHKFRGNEDIEVLDLERDIGAFSITLPRETKTAVDLCDFSPRNLLM